jgi:hypothetical protein
MITETGMDVTAGTASGLGVLGGVLACGNCKETLNKLLAIENLPSQNHLHIVSSG